MSAYALRPNHCHETPAFGSAQRICLAAAVLFHLAIGGLMYRNGPVAQIPPVPLTLSARWAGESSTHEAPAKQAAAAPKPMPPQPPLVKQKAPAQKPVVKKAVKQPTRQIKPTPPAQTAAKPARQAKAQPLFAPATPTTAAPTSQSSGSTPAPAKATTSGAGASSAPIARDARLHNPEPPYPPESRRRGEEGRVILKVRVTKEGTAESVEVENSSGYRRLDMVARKTVSRWRFIPARQDNATVAAWANVTIIFKLRT